MKRILFVSRRITFTIIIWMSEVLGSGRGLENRIIFDSSVHPSKVGSGPEVEN